MIMGSQTISWIQCMPLSEAGGQPRLRQRRICGQWREGGIKRRGVDWAMSREECAYEGQGDKHWRVTAVGHVLDGLMRKMPPGWKVVTSCLDRRLAAVAAKPQTAGGPRVAGAMGEVVSWRWDEVPMNLGRDRDEGNREADHCSSAVDSCSTTTST